MNVSKPRRSAMLTTFAAAITMLASLTALSPSSAGSAVATPSADRGEKLQPKLLGQFERAAGAPRDFWVTFGQSADLSGAQEVDDWVERGQYVYDRLRATAESSQAATVRRLEAAGVEYQTHWITNAIRVENGTLGLASSLAAQDSVERILAPVTYDTPDPIERSGDDDAMMQPTAVEWGLANIGADQVWQDGIDGGGIVVASIDTGVQYDHPALVNQYRGNNHDGSFTHDYNWFDAAGTCGDAPCDGNGHGTHTMGTMLGDDGAGNQIGVAPGATWITANGCCPTDQALMDSAEWMLAPTRTDGTAPDVSKRPHIINNSWGTSVPSTDPFGEDIQKAWAAAGIFGVWANGNNGPSCQSSGSPGSRTINYSVGAYDVNNRIADFSSRGTGQDGVIKPDIAAPGKDVRSSLPGSAYGELSGTSMATPHVAGAIALLWSAAPELVGDLPATRDLLDSTAIDAPDSQCGGDASNNNVYGEGRLDVVTLLAGRQVGLVEGRVIDGATDDGLADAIVRLDGAVGGRAISRTVRSDATGAFRASLPAGDYDLTVSSYAYDTHQDVVTVVEGASTTVNVTLQPSPTTTLSGTISGAAPSNLPLYAEVDIPGYPGAVFTDPETGQYSVEVPAGADYNVAFDPVYPGFPTRTETVPVGSDPTSHDVSITPDIEACIAPGLTIDGAMTTFAGWTGTQPLDGWRSTSRRGTWRFDNPRDRQQPVGGQGRFAIADADAMRRGRMDTTLTSPVFDLNGHSAPQLDVAMTYMGHANQRGSIEITTDGTNWTPVWSATTNTVTSPQTIPLPSAANQPAVQVRFTFTARDGNFWAVDNVFVGTDECVQRDGGLVVGDVREVTSGDPIPGARVSLPSVPGSAVHSRVIIDDPARNGAMYWLYAPGGAQEVRVDSAGHESQTETVTVSPAGVTRQDFTLTPTNQ